MAEVARTPFLDVEVVSADAHVWDGKASQVIARTTEGEIGIRPGHTPLLAALASGEVRVTAENGDRITAHAADGFISVSDNVVTVIAGEAAIRV